jgi:hypothetical protein
MVELPILDSFDICLLAILLFTIKLESESNAILNLSSL